MRSMLLNSHSFKNTTGFYEFQDNLKKVLPSLKSSLESISKSLLQTLRAGKGRIIFYEEGGSVDFHFGLLDFS